MAVACVFRQKKSAGKPARTMRTMVARDNTLHMMFFRSEGMMAGRYLQLLSDDIPGQWWCDPADVRYLSGCGLPQGRSRRLVGLLLEHFGASALQVSDKPGLERALVEFARVSEEPADA